MTSSSINDRSSIISSVSEINRIQFNGSHFTKDQSLSHTKSVIITGSVLERKKTKKSKKQGQVADKLGSIQTAFNLTKQFDSFSPCSLKTHISQNQSCSPVLLSQISNTKRQNIMTVQLSEGIKQQLQNLDRPDPNISNSETMNFSINLNSPDNGSNDMVETLEFDSLKLDQGLSPSNNRSSSKSPSRQLSPTPRRGNIIKFYQYELKFREDLIIVQKLFMKRLQESKMFPTDFIDLVLSTLFHKITDFINITNELIEMLDKKLAMETQNHNVTIGDVILNCIQVFPLYLEYTQHYPIAREFLSKQCQSNSKFRLWFENCQRQSKFKRYGLIGFLKSIKFHLIAYPTLLTEILNNTPKDHPDYMMIPDAINEIETILKQIHTTMNLTDNRSSATSDPGLSEGEADSRSSSSSVCTSPNSTQFSDIIESKPHIESRPQSPAPQTQSNTLHATNSSGFRKSIQAPIASWSQIVAQETLSELSPDEIKRQETIFELIQSERAFAKDLEVISVLFVEPLRNEDVFDPSFREAAIHKFFFNYLDIGKLSQDLANTLESRQSQNKVIDKIGDLLLPWSTKLHPFDIYGSRVQFANDYFVSQRSENAKFSEFIKRCDANPLANKLSMDSYISRPTTRLARYPLLLASILKKTPPGHSDHITIQQVITNIEAHLNKINEAKGNTDRKLRMVTIMDRLEYKGGSIADFHLDTPNRVLVKEGILKLHNSFAVRAFLFDNLLLLTRERQLAGDLVEYEVYKRPLFLSEIAVSNEVITSGTYGSLGIFDSIIGKDSSKVNEDLMFSIVHKETMDTFILSTISIFDRQHWIDAILNEADKFH